MTAELIQSMKWFLPELILIKTLVVLFLVDGFIARTRVNFVPLIIVVLGCLGAMFASCYLGTARTPFFSGLLVNDGLGHFFRYVFLFSTMVSLYLSFGSKEMELKSRMEFSLLILCVTIGLSLMALSTHFLMLYIGIETVSIISFVMAGFNRDSARSNEASLKYLVFGALSSGLMIYGFSLVYGYTGSLQYDVVAKYLADNPTSTLTAFPLALAMIYAGLAYKISAFPMHFWTPDVYEGAPTPVVAFFSVGPKAAGFAALIRILAEVVAVKHYGGAGKIALALGAISILTMLVGNLSAIGQTNVKRILAYSSIAHVGYMLMGLVTLNQEGMTAVLFYIAIYCIMNIGAFWAVSVVADHTGGDDLVAFSGAGWKMPVLGVCMAIFLFSLTGIPLFSGFIGKFLLFGAVLQVPGLLGLAIIGVLNSVVSLYYYAKILKAMWLERIDGASNVVLSRYDAVGLIALAIPTIVLGLFFGPILEFARQSLAHYLS